MLTLLALSLSRDEGLNLKGTYHPASSDSVADSMIGVSIHSFLIMGVD